MSTATNEIELELYIIRHGQTFGNLGKTMDNFSELDRNDVLLTEMREALKVFQERL